jgi:hypothetical protein
MHGLRPAIGLPQDAVPGHLSFPVLDQLLVEGIGSSDGRGLLADVWVALQGLHPGTVKDYLAGLGVMPDAQNLALACSGSVRIQGNRVEEANDVDSQGEQPLAPGEVVVRPSPSTLQVHLESTNAVLTSMAWSTSPGAPRWTPTCLARCLFA